MEGQVKSAIRFLDKNGNHGILSLTEEIINQLRQKHPEAQEATHGALLHGPIEEIPDTIFCKINGEMVREAALRAKGSGGPSGIDAVGVGRMVTCKSFKTSSVKLCDALALHTRKLCTQYVDPGSIEGLMACRLITLDKGDGSVRPIGVGEVFRRIIAKCVIQITKVFLFSFPLNIRMMMTSTLQFTLTYPTTQSMTWEFLLFYTHQPKTAQKNLGEKNHL